MEAIVAAFAALVALLAWRAQRAHNRLSVVPFPSIGLNLLHDRLKIELVNNGIGPMRVLTFRFVDEKGSSHASVLKVVSTRSAVVITSLDDSALGPDRRRAVIKMKANPSLNGKDLEQVCSELSRYKVVMEYTDVYGTKFPPYTRDLKWFAEEH